MACGVHAGSDIVYMDAVALSKAIHSRNVSCVEVMQAFLGQIDRLNSQVNAIVALQAHETLLALARERDEQLGRGQSLGPLHGFPLAVKDLQAVKGLPMTSGSPLFRDLVPSADGIMAARLRGAGAIFIGKTNTPEFGLGSHTYNPVYGVTRNAYDTTKSAGGSSGGAAVALALRMLPVADGSDYGGSLRNPAGWNGVFGFRTSIGRIPHDARDEWLPSMGVLGPMARNVADLAMLLDVLTGFDARAPLSLQRDDALAHPTLEKSFRGVRVAWGGDCRGHAPCEPAVLDVCGRAARSLEALGCTVEEAFPEFNVETLWEATIRLRGWQQGSQLLPYYIHPEQRSLLKPEAIFEVETGLRQSAYDITAASIVRSTWTQVMRRFLDKYDFLILPTAQVFPFDVDMRWPREINGHPMQTYHEWMKGTLLISMAGCPALAAPAGFNQKGLPIGIQIISGNRRELACMQLAHAYEGCLQDSDRRLSPLLAQSTR
jgi:amidase